MIIELLISKWWRRLAVVGLVLLSALVQAQLPSEQRIALLIGNGAYKTSPLPNPVNDVRLMEDTLKDLGFQVVKAENATRRDMQRLIRDFGEKLKQSAGVGVFYFAGHGVQVRGNNYLVPVDADIRAEDEVAFDSIDAQSVLEKMETAKNRINLLILDACRDNPFSKSSRSTANGLATMNAPSGSLVAYATSPGSVASDGPGKNGVYTEQLVKVLRQPGLPVEEVFKQVRSAVRRATNNQQTPWENTALEGQFYFRPVPQAAVLADLSGKHEDAKVVGANSLQAELAYWDSIKERGKAAELNAYIEQFPNGIFVGLAKARLQEPSSPKPGDKAKEIAPVAPKVVDKEGFLVMRDMLSGKELQIEILATKSDTGSTRWTTGDEVEKDGAVLSFRLGSVAVSLRSGALWKHPLQPGTSGFAQVNVNDGQIRAGEVDWKVVASGAKRMEVRASVQYQIGVSSLTRQRGTWTAIYDTGTYFPVEFKTDMRPTAPWEGSVEIMTGLVKGVP